MSHHGVTSGFLTLLLCFSFASAWAPSRACDTPGADPSAADIVVRINEESTSTSGMEILLGNPMDLEIGFFAPGSHRANSNNLDHPFDEFFRTEPNFFGSTDLYVIKPINRDGRGVQTEDDLPLLLYKVTCEPTPGTIISKVLRIYIDDVNDNAPQFLNAPYFLEISELTPAGLTIYNNIQAQDLDEGNNRVIFFSLQADTSAPIPGGETKFTIPSSHEGIVSVDGRLDFETMYNQTNGNASATFYRILLLATDNGDVPRTTTTTITVLIKDGDDQGPEFVYPNCLQSAVNPYRGCINAQYQASVADTLNQLTELTLKSIPAQPDNKDVQIIMQDRDTLNSRVECRISHTLPAGLENDFTVQTERTAPASKQYRCRLFVKGNRTRDWIQVKVILEAEEISDYRRVETAVVSVSVDGRAGQSSTTAGPGKGTGQTSVPTERPTVDSTGQTSTTTGPVAGTSVPVSVEESKTNQGCLSGFILTLRIGMEKSQLAQQNP